MSPVLEALHVAAIVHRRPVAVTDVLVEAYVALGPEADDQVDVPGQLDELVSSGEARRYRDDSGQAVYWPEPLFDNADEDEVELDPPPDPELADLLDW